MHSSIFCRSSQAQVSAHGNNVLPRASAPPGTARGWYIPLMLTGGSRARACS